MKRIIAILLSTIMLFSLSSCIYSQDDLNEEKQLSYEEGYKDGQASSYEDGYDEGYEIGFEEGHDEGYDEGYSDAVYDNGENDLSGYVDPTSFLTTDTAPAGTVWVTPHGKKYHEGWCQHIDGRHDLTYYRNASEAKAIGLTPCDECH